MKFRKINSSFISCRRIIFGTRRKGKVSEIAASRLEDCIFTKKDIQDIINNLQRYGHLDRTSRLLVEKQYSKPNETSVENIKELNSLLEKIIPLVTFGDFIRALADAGKEDMSRAILAERHGVSQNWPPKRELSNSVVVHNFFANLKRCAGNNSFQGGTECQLERILDSLNDKLKHCGRNCGRFQLLLDKRVMAYFLLAQQYSNPDERMRVMFRMRAEMPHNVDRTLFDTIFHAYMTVIWSLKDDTATAERHEQQAINACYFVMPGFFSIILRLCLQYKNNVFYLRRHRTDDLEHAFDAFKEIFKTFDYTTGDPNWYRTIAMLDMTHALLGIDWDFNVCEIERIKTDNIERARKILSTLQRPSTTRGKMFLYLCRARLYENIDFQKAETYARKALLLADDGCYYNVQKTNIQTYLQTLSDKTLPLANIVTQYLYIR